LIALKIAEVKELHAPAEGLCPCEVLGYDKNSALDRISLILVVIIAYINSEASDQNVEDAALKVECCAQERVSITAHDLFQAHCLICLLSTLLKLVLKPCLENGRRPSRIGTKQDAK
jgi:hypothetical protein